MSAILGQLVSAGIIALMVLLSVLLNFVQTYRSQKAVRRLGRARHRLRSVRRGGLARWAWPARSFPPGAPRAWILSKR